MKITDRFTIFVNGYQVTVNLEVTDKIVASVENRPVDYEYEEIGKGGIDALETVRKELAELDEPENDHPYGTAMFAIGDLRIEHHNDQSLVVKNSDGDELGELSDEDLKSFTQDRENE